MVSAWREACEGSKRAGKEAAEIRGAVRRRVAVDKNFMIATAVLFDEGGERAMLQRSVCETVRCYLLRTLREFRSPEGLLVRRSGDPQRLTVTGLVSLDDDGPT